MPEQNGLRDQAARDAIANHLEANMLVEAGAGSGKTESLSERMVSLVASGACGVEQMAAVTFTRKAAAELRARFRLKLEERLAGEQVPERRARLRIALTQLERMFAGTIHSFCAQVLRERPVEAGVAPGFIELDEQQDEGWRMRSWREYLERARTGNSALLRELGDAEVRAAELDGAFETVCRYPDADFPPGAGEMPAVAWAWQEVDSFWHQLDALLPKEIIEETTCEIQQRAREFGPDLAAADRSRPAVLARLLARWEKRSLKPVQNRWPTRAAALAAANLVQKFGDTVVTPFLAGWRQYVYRLVMTLALDARQFAAERRRHSAALNYEDLLQMSARLVRENAPVRAVLQRKYTNLFVDEFQDTDPIQTELLFLLGAAPGAGTRWEEAPLRPGALFLVGDPKQSIFRFRRADIDIYSQAKRRIRETGGEVVELTTSFRAAPELCTWANDVFSQLLPPADTRQQAAFHGLDPRPKAEPGKGRILQLCHPAGIGRGDVPAADASAVATYIRGEIEAGSRRPGDFLVLTRKKANLARYAAALEEMHVPFEASGSEAFSGSAAVNDLRSLLYALCHPDDGPALLGVLRGPLLGLSDEELFVFHQADGRLLLMAPAESQPESPVAEGIASLCEMFHWTRVLPAGAAVEKILERTGLLARAAAESFAGGEAGKLIFAVDCLRAVAEQGASLAEAVDVLESRLGAGESDAPALEPGRRDVVRVMNLHKAKGLEAQVVFLADPLSGVEPRAEVRVIREAGRSTGFLRVTRKRGEYQREVIAEPANWAQHEQAELQYVVAEEIRLLYVAATRPKETLVVSRWEHTHRGPVRPWEPLAPFLTPAPRLELVPHAVGAAADTAHLGDQARVAAAAARDATRSLLLTPSWAVQAVTEAEARRGGPRLADYGGPAGRDWGGLVHALLQYAALHPNCSREDLERWAMWHARGNEAQMQEDAVTAVQSVMEAPFWSRLLAAEQRFAEVPICFPAVGKPPVIVNGIVDLALRFPDGWEIVDYKTDLGDIGQLTAMYAEQVRLYADCWEKITGEVVRFAGIYSVRMNAMSGEVRTAAAS
jgi:ATP-dependent helicase/nuclease subunit A